ncbi:MAG: hypothetical protein FRX48_00007 [Lasallia pustulata]|uniref:DUF7707 domain-containing protein n=1 Tax=Lasallia pustulata TaxID=136370 RepID=A0A1W5DAG8_9LECA|nr:MAG: hypothetical protein FRX48_00007 [Lasallia pustulata]SLM40147.1 hypothetical protein LPUS_10839 [Lasallia pustulata]
MSSLTAVVVIITTLASFCVSQSIDPNSVPLSTRQQWCNDQMSSCPLICLQLPGTTASPEANNCNATALTYSCVCSNGLQPNSSQYSQTLPYYLCTESNNQCVSNCTGDSACQSACRTSHPCGAQSPVRVTTTSTTDTMSATTTDGNAVFTTPGGVVYTGYVGSAATTTAASGQKRNANSLAIGLGQTYGVAVVFAGFLVGFACML